MVSPVWSSTPGSTRQTQFWPALSTPESMAQSQLTFGQLGEECYDFGTAHDSGIG